MPDKFSQLIASHGYAVWWSRALICPCQGNNQTDRQDLMCPLCRNKGWTYVIPDQYLRDGGEDGQGNKVEISDDGNSVGTQAIITSTTSDPQVYERFGQWVFGTCRLTTYGPNRVGYMDRMTCRDSVVTYSQVVVSNGKKIIRVTGKRSRAGIWSPLEQVSHFRSLDTNYRLGDDFSVNDDGEIEWLITPPAPGTRLALSGSFYPRFVVMDHVRAIRDAQVSKKKGSFSDRRKQHTKLPVQVMAKLDFLVED